MDFDGEIIGRGKAMVPAAARSVYYGEGCFCTFRSYAGKFLRLGEHIKRVNRGMETLEAGPILDEAEIRERVGKLLEAAGLSGKQAKIRVQAGILEKPLDCFTLITAEEIGGNPSPQKLILSDYRNIPKTSLPSDVKWSNYLPNILALKQAKKAGADNAVMLNAAGYISETATANLFWVQNGSIFTPDGTCDILPGVTRQVLLDALSDDGIEVQQGAFKDQVLQSAEHVFLTSAVQEIVMASRYKSIEYKVEGDLVDHIRFLFQQRKETEQC